ncbi:hypothetical protein [Halovivax gelatinilyticus]|uniref:hypothetical protein n=1 Tax=Halovivax gelatinilyticus TaxID=2961597 RepID=UPI0020CA7854|nr:hypothetical protein [Halovivax gelatinilyticus]
MSDQDETDAVETAPDTEPVGDDSAAGEPSTEQVSGEIDAESDESFDLEEDEPEPPRAEETDPSTDPTVDETTSESRPQREGVRANSVRAAGLVAGLGVLIFWSPILLTGYGYSMLLNVGVGVTIAVLASITVIKAGADVLSAVVLPAVIALLAAAVVASAFVFDLGSDALFVSNLVVGGLAVVLSVLAIFGFRKASATASDASAA